MCGRATLMMDESMVPISVPKLMEIVMSHLLTGRRRAGTAGIAGADGTVVVVMAASATDVDRDLGRHAGAQREPRRQADLRDAHGHALHDLDEVAGGVVRRQQGEAGAGATR